MPTSFCKDFYEVGFDSALSSLIVPAPRSHASGHRSCGWSNYLLLNAAASFMFHFSLPSSAQFLSYKSYLQSSPANNGNSNIDITCQPFQPLRFSTRLMTSLTLRPCTFILKSSPRSRDRAYRNTFSQIQHISTSWSKMSTNFYHHDTPAEVKNAKVCSLGHYSPRAARANWPRAST